MNIITLIFQTLLRLLDVITEKTLQATCCITAARGRGKSAALGLAIAGAIGFDYANIFVTSPAPDNLKTLFEFVVKGLEAMNYEEHTDFELIQSTNKQYNKALVRINIFKGHRQVIQVRNCKASLKENQFSAFKEKSVFQFQVAVYPKESKCILLFPF